MEKSIVKKTPIILGVLTRMEKNAKLMRSLKSL